MGEKAELDFFFMLFAKLKFQVDKKCNMKSKTCSFEEKYKTICMTLRQGGISFKRTQKQCLKKTKTEKNNHFGCIKLLYTVKDDIK